MPSPSPEVSKIKIISRGVILFLVTVAIAVFLLMKVAYVDHLPLGRTESEIAAFSAAIESYKADHGHYPNAPGITDALKPNTTFDPRYYIASSEILYKALAGKNGDSKDNTVYFPFLDRNLKTTADGHTYIADPWGNSIGYSTFKAAHPESKDGNNPTYDLWSTNKGTRREDQRDWITNW